ncbi:MAG: arginine--tRNA ligase [Clostridia bacterium]|nr:arginine--tRNA ligase [Clostridia bacterium]
MKQRIADLAQEMLHAAFPEAQGLPQDLAALMEVPPDPAMGDYAFPCFKLSKALRMGPPQIAQKLAAAVEKPEIARVECVGGYLNFFFNRENFARELLSAIMAAPEKWGSGEEGKGKTVCLDYSSINIAKRFHIGHLSTTVIGNSLRRIYDFEGWKTVSINHLGDWGTQFGKMICAYKKWGDKETVEKGGVDEMTRLYVRFNSEAKKDPALEEEGRAWFKKIEDGDPEVLEIFHWFKDVTLKDAMRVYDILDVHFDSYAGESFYADKTGRVVKELEEKGLLKDSDGAKIVDLEEWNMPPCLILKSDGATLYHTRDIAAAIYRKETYHFDRCLYVVAYQQDLHFKQLFKVLELMGYDWAKDQCQHVAFGMVSVGGEPLHTRTGAIVYLDDLLRQAIDKARGVIEEKSPNLENKDEIARQIGVGAVVYSTLFSNRIKDIDYPCNKTTSMGEDGAEQTDYEINWDKALSFDGETGPYVQYTFARCCSVLRKAPQDLPAPDYAVLTDDESQALLRLLSRFPEAVSDACDRNEPYLVTRAVTDVAKAYNKFYYEHRILDDDPAATAARLQMTDACRQVIKTGLYLIGLSAPERM